MVAAEPAPKTEEELLANCQRIAGLTFAQLASQLNLLIPQSSIKRKGWMGQAMERALGATAKNLASPDFEQLGIELKTLPLNLAMKPRESTYVTAIPLMSVHQQTWLTSQCYDKLRRVLWIPIEGDPKIPLEQRRIGMGKLWSPTKTQFKQLEEDWNYLTNMICLGQLEQLNARHGTYLQIRPKAANAKSLCDAFDSEGNKIKTLPRGFYLRTAFTAEILENK